MSGRWVLPILEALKDGPLRRAALRQRLGTVSGKILTETLRRMEASSLISRSAVLNVPVEVDYELTDRARSLWPLLEQVLNWTKSSAPS